MASHLHLHHMPSSPFLGYSRARHLGGRWPLSRAYTCFHLGSSSPATFTSPGIPAGPQFTCSGSFSLRTWLKAAFKCLSWSFDIMVLNMKTLKFSEKHCVLYAIMCIMKWKPFCGPLIHELHGFTQIAFSRWARVWPPP